MIPRASATTRPSRLVSRSSLAPLIRVTARQRAVPGVKNEPHRVKARVAQGSWSNVLYHRVIVSLFLGCWLACDGTERGSQAKPSLLRTSTFAAKSIECGYATKWVSMWMRLAGYECFRGCGVIILFFSSNITKFPGKERTCIIQTAHDQ
jgi:hypothetical protein